MTLSNNMNKEYYTKHLNDFINDTTNTDMSTIYKLFEKYLTKQAKILDIGFGSARDMLYFNQNYDVYGIDIVDGFIENAKSKNLKNVTKLSVLDMNYYNEFNAIWACASLLHINEKDLNEAFKKCSNALLPNGIMYCSFKYGNFQGERKGRYYIDLTEESIKKYLSNTNMEILEYMITLDARPNRSDKWLNVILKKIEEKNN